MNNKTKMAIKAIPGVSTVVKALNRTVGLGLRNLKALPAMKRRNAELNERIAALPSGPGRIWYFGVPTHSNLGDQAQKFVILSWLAREYPDREIVKIASNAFNGDPKATVAAIQHVIRPDDLIVMQSGHTMDGIHPDETSHRAVSLAFPENRIVFFPTSIHFNGRTGMEKDRRDINAHVKTLFLARDPVSFQKARELYPKVDVRLFPDVVTSLIGNYSYSFERRGVLLCTRNDGEKLYSYCEMDDLARALSSLDTVDRSDTTVDWGDLDFDSEEAWGKIEQVISDYSRYRCVVTDRYHGTIFARIAGTPVVVLKTNDHKVVSGAEWFTNAGDNGIVLADDLNEVCELVQNMLTEYPCGISAPAFSKQMYEDELPRLIASM